MSERTVPHSIESERIVIGSMMHYREAALLCRQRLTVDDFMREVHGRMFTAVDGPIDASALAHRLPADDPLYVLDVQGSASVNWKHHLEIVASSAESRRVIAAGTDIVALGYDGGSAADAIGRSMALASESEDATGLTALMLKRVDDYRQPTDYFMLPASAVKCHYGDVTIIAGRPGTGKTALAIVAAYARSQTHKVGFFSYEMSADELGDRFISHVTGLSTEYTYDGLSDTERAAYLKAVETVGERDLTVVGCSGWGEAQLGSALALFAAKGGRIAFVDYLQIAYDITRAGENADITRMSKMLRKAAKSTGLAIVAVSQFRRFEGADDSDKKITYPKMSDLRGSGSLEQDAANICLMYAYPGVDSKLGQEARKELSDPLGSVRLAADLASPQTLLRLHWAKVRHGRGGERTWAFFDGNSMRFSEIDRMN